MIFNKLTRVILVLLSITFIILVFLKQDFYSDWVSAILLFLLTFLYMRENKGKLRYLFYFLISFTLAKTVAVITNYVGFRLNDIDIAYYTGNGLYILSYIFLIIRCLSSMNFMKVLKKFPATIIILVILGVFSVSLITDTAQSQLSITQYYVELFYNTVIMFLVSVGLISYMYKEDNKAMLFFVGTMFIFFSEMIQLAYFYIAEMPHLGLIYSALLVLAFAFFYIQSRLTHNTLTKEDLLFGAVTEKPKVSRQ